MNQLVQLRDTIFEFHHGGNWQEALTLIENQMPHFSTPAEIAKLTYWKACFLSLLGRTDEALSVLQTGLEHGLWWSEVRLRYDDDLAALQGVPAYESLIDECILRHQQAEATEHHTSYLAAEPPTDAAKPFPCLLALHGYAGNAAITLPAWAPIAAHGWLVAALQSSQLADMDDFHWMNESQSAEDVQKNLRDLSAAYPLDFDRLAIGGYSNGARTALMLTLTGMIRAKWVISVGGSLRDETLARIDWQAVGNPRILLIVGEHDDNPLTRMTQQAELFRSNGLDVTLQIVPNMGHNIPQDLAERVIRFLG